MANDLQTLFAALRSQQLKIESLERSAKESQALLRHVSDAPKWIEEIPGGRVPFFATIDITIAASSTSRAEGTYTVPTDGPFVCTGIGLFYQRTAAPYNGLWAPATTYDAKIAPVLANLGFGNLFDSPLYSSFDVEIAESGADRNWQNNSFASALFNEKVGGVYIFPTSRLIGPSSVITVRVTPTIALAVAGKLQVLLLGYKIVQAATYQP